MSDAQGAFADALRQRDIVPPDPLIADGRIHRCDAAGKNGKGDAAYLLHLDDFPAGGFENHRDGLGWSNWKAQTDRQFTASEKAAHRSRLDSIKREREADDKKRREEAADIAKSIWRDAKPAPADHPYLVRKGIQAHGLRQHEGRLVIPLRDSAALCSLQFIDASGDKRFLPNGRTRGCYFAIGQQAATLCVAEGYATAAAIHEATGHAVAVAFNANNIEPVALALRAKFPDARLIVCADDDHATEGNPGLSRATAAAKAVGGLVAVPDFSAERPDGATDFNDLLKHGGVQAVRDRIESAHLVEHEAAAAETDQPDGHRNAPRPDAKCLYGLVGDVATAGSATTEANAFAIALNFLVYLSVAVGRGSFMSVGDTWHHPRIFGLHVGRSGRGRKGDAVGLIHRIDMAVRAKEPTLAPQTHSGGLSTREGLVLMIHDGFKEGKSEVEPVLDKRLWIVESEFANVLHQSRRDGNTLSAALRDAWDGKTIKPATKTNRIGATDPHVGISAAITPSELQDLLRAREISNGFANRFLLIWSERDKVLPFPQSTPQHVVDALADRIISVIKAAGADRPADANTHRISLNPEARAFYDRLYRGELSSDGAASVSALLERRAPMLLRIAMLFALCDLEREVDARHIEAALAWVRYWADSVRFVFSTADDEARAAQVSEAADRIVAFLSERRATRTEISRHCFGGHLAAKELDAALDELIMASPSLIAVESVPRPKGNSGTPTKFYGLAAKSAKCAKREGSSASPVDSGQANSGEMSEVSPTTVRTVRTVRNLINESATRADAHSSHNSHSSHSTNSNAMNVPNLPVVPIHAHGSQLGTNEEKGTNGEIRGEAF